MAEVNKKKRSKIEDKDKAMLLNILKTKDNGRIWKTITEGTSTTQSRYDAWEAVTTSFNAAAQKDLTRYQVRNIFQRLKQKKKAEHDQKVIDRQINKSCSKTGGGKGPLIPEFEDGDNLDLEFHDLNPIDTNFNRMVRPNFRSDVQSSCSRAEIPTPSPVRPVIQVESPPPGVAASSSSRARMESHIDLENENDQFQVGNTVTVYNEDGERMSVQVVQEPLQEEHVCAPMQKQI